MCTIVDANVVSLVFSNSKDCNEAVKKFWEYIDEGKLKLVVGGKLMKNCVKSQILVNG